MSTIPTITPAKARYFQVSIFSPKYFMDKKVVQI